MLCGWYRYFNSWKKYWTRQLRIIYISFVQSIIAFGIEIWGGGLAYEIHLNKLKLTMNKIIKFILKIPILIYTKFIYKELNVLYFDKLLMKCTLLLNFKYKMYLPSCYHIYNTRLKKNIFIRLYQIVKNNLEINA